MSAIPVACRRTGNDVFQLALRQDRRAQVARCVAYFRRGNSTRPLSLWAGNNLILAITAISIATMALYSFPSPFWALPTAFLSGTAAAASIAFINSIGNLGGFAGPYVIGFLDRKDR